MARSRHTGRYRQRRHWRHGRVGAADLAPPRQAIERLDDGKMPLADLCRRVGARADELGLTRPSYEQVRVLAHRERRWRALYPTTGEVLRDVALRVRPPEAIADQLSGNPPPKKCR